MKSLNQYTERDVPGAVDVLGVALASATVTVNSQSPYRRGEYFRKELSVANSSAPLWQAIAVTATDQTTVNGNVFVPQTPEAFSYDDDGNLTQDGRWDYTWDAENRRIIVESRSALPAAAKVKEQWTHLADGRWIERIVSTWNPSTLNYQPSTTNRYVWDGQVLLAVLDHTNGVVVSFLRGLDLSGSIQGAGGVGGVLAVKVGPAVPSGPLANTTHFTCYDGNGNVTALVNAATGAESARYAYGPFAEPLQQTGPMAKLNPIRFSTQYHDDYTGDEKYVFRDLRDGRWPNRDPIGEWGGINLYACLDNDLVNWVDILGLVKQHHRPDGGLILEVEKCEIVFYFGHGNPKNSPDFLFPSAKARGGCPYAGGAVACFADNINTRITKHGGILIPGSPTANTDPIWTGNVDPLRQNTEIDAAFQSMRAGVVQLVNDWLKNKKACCPSVKVTFIGYDNKPKVKTFTTPITGYDPSK